MIRLKQAADNTTINLAFGVTATVTPLTSASMAISQAEASKVIDGLKEQVRQRRQAGLPPDSGLPALEHGAAWEGIYLVALAKALAAAHIKAWDGVADEGGAPAPVNQETINQLMDIYPFAERLVNTIASQHLAVVDAKNASAPSPAGTSSAEEGRATAEDATIPESPAPAAA